ncbi:alpha/beta hydrolase [Romboutsia weinsteinii]|uniref:Alpha/beta hydrolase n=1 Tax=Romboutsia weinsteinii TaxID=2020949 RepID=A0A371J456_9FIRM|nr:alpha/beta hydrolase [Romboutsia weinsteinii]RDY27571.1 alpha/beta hydrolase [Romboutsia weinsteinii]
MGIKNLKSVIGCSLAVCLITINCSSSLVFAEKDVNMVESQIRMEGTEKVELDNGIVLNSKEMGSGDVTIVFDTGYGNTLDNFTYIQGELSKIAKTLTYDRVGLGESSDTGNMAPLSENERETLMRGGVIEYNEADFDGTTKTAKDKANNLYKLLQAKNLPEPYILVTHSLGGHTAIEFAKMHKEKVDGIVFIDSTGRSSNGEMYEFFESFVPGMGDEQLSLYSKHDGTLDEVLMGENQVKNDKNVLRDIPLLYLECDPYAMAQGAMGDAFAELKTRQINDLLSMSDDTKHVQIKDATHQVHTDKPEETLAHITEFINYCVGKN